MGNLVKCKECGHEVARSAKTCPQCGVNNPAVKSSHGCLTIIGLMFVIFIFASIGHKDKTPEQIARDKAEAAEDTCNSKSMAQVMAENFVKRGLKSPSTADFPFTAEKVVSLGDCTFIVQSHVDAQNGFGAIIRSKTLVKLQYQKDIDQWQLIDMSIN